MNCLRARANRLTGNDQLHTSILLSPGRAFVGSDRLCVTEASRCDGIGRDALRHEIGAH